MGENLQKIMKIYFWLTNFEKSSYAHTCVLRQKKHANFMQKFCKGIKNKNFVNTHPIET